VHRPPRAHLRRPAPLLAAMLTTVCAATAWPAPVQDDDAGAWSDEFEANDTAPGRSMFDGEHVEFDGDAGNGVLRLVAPTIPTIEGRLLQIDWSGGRSTTPSDTLVFETRYANVSSNILTQNFPGRAVMAPLVGEQVGARPVARFPVTPIKGVADVVIYYAYNAADQSTNAAIPSQSSVTSLYFYREVDTGALSFLTVTNEKDSTNAPNGALALQVEGLPADTTLAFSDNPGAMTLDGTTATGQWAWGACCSEGGGLTLGRADFDFTVSVVPAASVGFAAWRDSFTYRVYSEADANAFPFALLAKPTDPDNPEPVTVAFHGAAAGTLNSVIYDFGEIPFNARRHYLPFTWEADVPDGGSIAFSFRIGDTEQELRDAPWSTAVSDPSIDVRALVDDPRRFFQYRATFRLPPDGSSGLDPDPVLALRRVEMPWYVDALPVLEPEGWAVSVLIDPRPDPVTWQRVRYAGSPMGAATNIGVDVLDGESFEVLLANVLDDEDISQIDPVAHPSLRLRARLSQRESVWPEDSPTLNSWGVTWISDRDGDHVPNTEDNCPNFPNQRQADADQDGLGDPCDPDVDGDLTDDAVDNCPLDPNPDQADNDRDDVGDACDEDDDNDGIFDLADNCPLVANTAQDDRDGDRIGDVCDDDLDGDGLSNADEDAAGTDPRDADSDDDGVLDGDEADWSADSDGDTLINALDPDSDDDGLLDGTEAGVTTDEFGPDTDAAAGHFVADLDPNSTTDPTQADSDGDGVDDGEEDLNHDGALDDGESDPSDGEDGGAANNGANNGGATNNGTNNGGASNNGTDGNTDNNGGAPAAGGTTDDGGCGCATPTGRASGGPLALALLILGSIFITLRRERRS